MAREIRITVDDDEVFERMKARKAALDLTWEDALKRGLRADDRPSATGALEAPSPPDRNAPGTPDPASTPGTADPSSTPGFGDAAGSDGEATRERADSSHANDRGASGFGDFADQLRQQIQGQVRESLEASMTAAQRDLDREMQDLQAAEDAVLRFDVLDDEPRYDVPLRVRMESSRSGLDVDVVAVREGKSVTGTNRFDRAARRAVNEHLATGGTATLAFGANGDAETYAVAPVCSWGRHDDGTPRVASVEVHEVVFDEQ